MSPSGRDRAAILPAAALLVLLLVPRVACAKVLVQGLRFWSGEDYTRVAIDLDGEARFEANVLKADPARNQPARIYVDIHDAVIREEILKAPMEVRNGLLKVVRAGRHRQNVVRVVLDLERESGFRAFEMGDPNRIVVDVSTDDSGTDRPVPDNAARTGTEAAPGRVPEAAPREAPAASRGGRTADGVTGRKTAERRPIRVMLDPGHGGKDPGAIGPTGLKEKDVVLRIGKLVRLRLEDAGGIEVMMTRETDVFVPLEERTAMANKARADIFVSLHANASPNRRAEGISTYVLSRASHATDREALELAARENGVSVRKLSAVKFIIDDLATYGRKKESLRLAKTVNDAIVRNARRRFGPVQDLGLRQAPFYVLVGARMTAVLVEASFISNAREEARLREEEYLASIADSVTDAVRFYGANGALARAAR